MNTSTARPKNLDSHKFEQMTADDVVSVLATDTGVGLKTTDAEDRLRRFGANEVSEKKTHPLLSFLKKFWGLTAWMLELIIILSWILHKTADVYIVGGLLIMNSIISFLEEQKASRAVEELKTKLQIQARTLRDGAWTLVPARELVPGDILRIRSGDFIPADLKILNGALAVDQSALTGESLPLEKTTGDLLYAGSVLKRGEASGVVIQTGPSTNYGKTAQLVQIARPKLHMEEVVSKLVRWLLMIIGGLLSLTLGISILRGFPLLEILPLMLVLLLSAIPVALPVMFTVSMAVGARELARHNVLITRLSATEDAATMDVLCVDKTGTLTLNELSISHIIPLGPFSDKDVILYGALASQEANQDPLDLAFIKLAKEKDLLSLSYIQDSFVPFDPLLRKTEALIKHDHKAFRVMKGAVSVIAQACGLGSQELKGLEARIEDFSKKGYKTLAVALIENSNPVVAGLAALSDSPRPDSKALIQELQALGISIKMLTGDALPIAQEVAGDVGIGNNVSRMSDLKALMTTDRAAALRMMEKSAGFAEVYPEDKYVIVQSLQAGAHVVGMTGDGVNDAPALKQAEVGIAVNSATDIAKASASVVLTSAGLSGIVELVKNGRKVYQRINTWVLNKIMRTVLKSSFVVGVFLITGDFVVSAFTMVLLLLMTDFVKISLSTDHVRWSKSPDTWNIASFVKVSAVLGILMVLESLVLFWLGLKIWHLSPSDPHVQTFSFVILFFSAVSSIFVVRERRHFWSSAPSRMLLTVIFVDMLVGIMISALGIPGALQRIPLPMTAFVIGFNIIFSLFVNDFVKIRLINKMKLGSLAERK
jgi:H+-transporting ATPase